MKTSIGGVIYKNLANVVSILGVLPLCLLLVSDGYQYLIPLIVYNNIMDDLDGILAAKLNIRSRLGANLDNLCDAVSHVIFVMVILVHFLGDAQPGNLVCATLGMGAVVAILLRVGTRLDPGQVALSGSPTNELIRHLLFMLLLANTFSFDPVPYLGVVFLFHTVSMLVPFAMPHQIRSLAKSTFAISMVNVALIVAWLMPGATPIVAAFFFGAYLFSLSVGAVRQVRGPSVGEDFKG
jgi:phosphatidylserine synthase